MFMTNENNFDYFFIVAGIFGSTNGVNRGIRFTCTSTGTGTGYTGVKCVVACSDVKLNTWLLVDFADHGKKSKKCQLYLGRVGKIFACWTIQKAIS